MNRRSSVAMVQNIAVATHISKLTGRLLDIGCGSKPYKRLENAVTEWVGLDSRPVGDVQSDFHELPFEDESFDSVLSVDSLQYALDPVVAFAEMARVLKIGGTLLLVCPNTAPEDGSICFDLKMRWLTNACQSYGLTVDVAETASKAWEHEFANYANTNKHGAQMPPDASQFAGWLDMNFPALNIIVAHKEQTTAS